MTPEKIYAKVGSMKSPVGIKEAAIAIGNSMDSLRRWERKGKITSRSGPSAGIAGIPSQSCAKR